jgi:uncharacterized protein YcfJ
MLLPYTVDYRTISLYEVTDPYNPTTSQVKWTRVEKGYLSTSDNQRIFTVQNAPTGYLVTTNFPNAKQITTSSSVLVKAVVSYGAIGNDATISDPNSVFQTLTTPSGGYNTLSVDAARAKLLFSTTQDRCVTITDYTNAILSSNIPGTSTQSNISVRNGNVPGSVNVYVSGLDAAYQTVLTQYLANKAVAGTTVIYGA